jgi:hypothetical protein
MQVVETALIETAGAWEKEGLAASLDSHVREKT